MGRTVWDQKRRSKEDWERGQGAKKKGNPRYKPKMVYSSAYKKKVKRYCVR